MTAGSLEFTTFEVIIEDRDDVTYDISTPEGRDNLKGNPFILKEACRYKMRIGVNAKELVSGLAYYVAMYRKGFQVSKEKFMFGSLGPDIGTQYIKIPCDGMEEAPSGLLSRGSYTAKMSLTDDYSKDYGTVEYAFEIKPDW
ncbi:hypothetical protein N7451_000708 [Penicillium sp. IBT 35674x]|nr:hypothetical protein N7451_000708 [Penicillium sp. IBT 35674x]